MKVEPVKFQEDNLHRHPDFAPKVKQETAIVKRESHQTPLKPNSILRTRTDHLGASLSGEFDDEFDGNLFDGVDILGESQGEEFSFESGAPSALGGINGVTPSKPAPVSNGGPSRQPFQRAQNVPPPRGPNGAPQSHPPNNMQNGNGRPASGPPNARPPQTPVQQNANHRPDLNRARMQPPTADIHVAPKPVNQNQNQNQKQNQNNASSGQANQNQPLRPTPPPGPPQQQPKPASLAISTPAVNPPTNHRPPVGFVTSRAAELLQNDQPPASLSNLPAFNPNVESPIPKAQRTPGIDHAASRPIKRQDVNAPTLPLPPPNLGPPATGGAGGFGRPGQGAGRGTSNFINPQQDANRRIGMPGAGAGAGMGVSPMNRGQYKPPMKRPPLTDVSNNQGSGGGNGSGEPDAKRQRVEGVEGAVENGGVAQ